MEEVMRSNVGKSSIQQKWFNFINDKMNNTAVGGKGTVRLGWRIIGSMVEW